MSAAKPASPSRELARLAWPVLVAQLAVMANGVIDTAMAGRLSAIDLAAVGIGASIQVTVLMSVMGVLLALPPLIAHLYGAGHRAEIGREIHQSVWVSAAIALIAILLLRYPEPFIAISALQPAVEAKVRAYLDASAWGVPAAVAFRLFFGLSTGIGRPRPVMIFNLVTLALKLPLNALFMYGLLGAPALGAPGCAVATAIDAWIMATLAWGWCLGHPDYAEFGLRARFSAPDRAAIWAFLRLGVPIGMTFLADVTAFTFMALFIARLGPVVSGAHQIAANLAALAFMVPLSLGNATAILAGQAIGAGQARRARHLCWTALGLGMSLAVVVSLTLWLGAPQIAALYTPDVQVQAAAAPLIALVGAYHLADALQAVAVNALRGYKKSAVPMLIYTVALWGLGLGGGVVLGLTDVLGPARGAAGFWMAAIASLWLVGGLVALYLNRISRPQRT
ncbi:MAG: MATE family efflux transporter [Rhodocyclaceae bacterium]|nr:MATE family efflux transporter [Rhodocyclaceae bacterium]